MAGCRDCGRVCAGRLCRDCQRDRDWEDRFDAHFEDDHDDDDEDGGAAPPVAVPDGGTDTVLVRSQRHSNCGVYHLPDPEDPEQPRCHIQLRNSEDQYQQLPRDRLPDNYSLCDHCNPDYEVERSNTGPELGAQLRAMDPDDLVTDGGQVPASIFDTITDAIAEHTGDDGAPVGAVIQDTLEERPDLGLDTVTEALQQLEAWGDIYHPTATTVRLTATDDGGDREERQGGDEV